MKRLIVIAGIFALLLFTTSVTVTAQNNTSGKITYARIVGHGLKAQSGKAQWNSYIANLPNNEKVYFSLSFTKNKAMYEQNLATQDESRQDRLVVNCLLSIF